MSDIRKVYLSEDEDFQIFDTSNLLFSARNTPKQVEIPISHAEILTLGTPLPLDPFIPPPPSNAFIYPSSIKWFLKYGGTAFATSLQLQLTPAFLATPTNFLAKTFDCLAEDSFDHEYSGESTINLATLLGVGLTIVTVDNVNPTAGGTGRLVVVIDYSSITVPF